MADYKALIKSMMRTPTSEAKKAAKRSEGKRTLKTEEKARLFREGFTGSKKG